MGHGTILHAMELRGVETMPLSTVWAGQTKEVRRLVEETP